MNKTTEEQPVIYLSDAERAKAEELGSYKHNKSEREGRRVDYDPETAERNHQDGVAGEMAASFLMGKLFEFRIDNFKGADIGANYEVRTTKQTRYDFKVKARDKDERVVIAMRQLTKKAFRVLGWMTVREAKLVGILEDPGDRGIPAYFVYPGKVYPIATLPKEKHVPGFPR